MKSILFAAALAMAMAVLAPLAQAEKIETADIEYNDGDAVLQGYLAHPMGAVKRPGVLIIHQWKGITDYERRRANELAELGFVAFVADIYGKGIRPSDPKEAGEMAGKFKADRALLRSRARAGLETLKSFAPKLEPDNVAAIGYCFGGTSVLEMARDGQDVRGVVSFHGGLDAPAPAKPGDVKAKILVLHGADDPHVNAEQVAAFQQEMRGCGADWQFVAYGGAVHSFSDPGAGNDNSKGAAYNEAADRRSWGLMKDFFREILAHE